MIKEDGTFESDAHASKISRGLVPENFGCRFPSKSSNYPSPTLLELPNDACIHVAMYYSRCLTHLFQQ